MAYTNSPLATYTRISPNRNSPRNQPITKITVHHIAGIMSIEQFGALVANPGRQMSSNYAIGNDGRIGLFCPEKDRSWCSSSPWNDNRAITIEVSNSAYGDASGWPIGTAAYNSLIKLCADICKRNGIKKLYFTGNSDGTLTYHYMFNATGCPGPWMKAHTQDLCNKVNALLNSSTEQDTPKVEGKIVTLTAGTNIYDAPGGKRVGDISASNKFTIVEEKTVGDTKYGKLKSGAGWVILEITKPTTNTTFKVGDLVKINSDAVYYNGGGIPEWVKRENWYIATILNDRAVVGLNEAKNRNIQSPINTKYLTLVTTAEEKSNKPEPFKEYTVSLKSTDLVFITAGGATNGTVGATGVFTIVEDKVINGVTYGKLKSGLGWVVTKTPDVKKGDKVKIINPIVYGTNKKFTQFVSTYWILEVKGDRVVISSDGKNVTTAISKSNIRKV